MSVVYRTCPSRTGTSLAHRRVPPAPGVCASPPGCGYGHCDTTATHRVDRGAYVSNELWRTATPEQRHLLRCRAVLRHYGAVALSHTSAVVAYQ